MDLKKQFTTVTSFSKILAVVLFVVLPFIFFFFGAWYAYTANETLITSNTVPNTTVKNQVVYKPVPVTTYTNSQYGFSIQYPSEWTDSSYDFDPLIKASLLKAAEPISTPPQPEGGRKGLVVGTPIKTNKSSMQFAKDFFTQADTSHLQFKEWSQTPVGLDVSVAIPEGWGVPTYFIKLNGAVLPITIDDGEPMQKMIIASITFTK